MLITQDKKFSTRLKPHPQRGFTLLEVLLVITLITTLTGGMFILIESFAGENDLLLSASIVSHGFHSAQIFSLSGRQDGPWGIHITSEGITIFQGTSYVGRYPEQDREILFPQAMNIWGLDEVIFDQTSGKPNTTGDITLSIGTETKTLLLNSLGVLIY